MGYVSLITHYPTALGLNKAWMLVTDHLSVRS